jgi:hypothetical protein
VLTDYDRLATFVPNLAQCERVGGAPPGRIRIRQRGCSQVGDVFWSEQHIRNQSCKYPALERQVPVQMYVHDDGTRPSPGMFCDPACQCHIEARAQDPTLDTIETTACDCEPLRMITDAMTKTGDAVAAGGVGAAGGAGAGAAGGGTRSALHPGRGRLQGAPHACLPQLYPSNRGCTTACWGAAIEPSPVVVEDARDSLNDQLLYGALPCSGVIASIRS